MSALDRTLDQYHELMRINAVSHLIRAARRVGILQELGNGQRTADQLCQTLSLAREPTGLLLDALVRIGVIERYDDDHALSQAARLLCQYDEDLGDRLWERLTDRVKGSTERDQNDDQLSFDYTAATQWTHTPEAIQVAETLGIGGRDDHASGLGDAPGLGDSRGLSILDIGCGSAVWSCAMAHRDPAARLTLVDGAGALQAAMSTAESIGLADRLTLIEGDPATVPLPADEFDVVLIAQRLQSVSENASSTLLGRAVSAAKPGGRIVVVDLFSGSEHRGSEQRGPEQRGPEPRGPGRDEPENVVAERAGCEGADLGECIEALRLNLETSSGSIRTPQQVEIQMQQFELQRVEFTFLSASRINLGLIVAVKPG